jgi:hypothetical protein
MPRDICEGSAATTHAAIAQVDRHRTVSQQSPHHPEHTHARDQGEDVATGQSCHRAGDYALSPLSGCEGRGAIEENSP